mmetsp:Transcript_56229/g.62984  ORF Transcript_56229/g.62984 Transcript_56229/m.62984 type:complete len:194 (+) Transcript_56229:161-742(+)
MIHNSNDGTVLRVERIQEKAAAVVSLMARELAAERKKKHQQIWGEVEQGAQVQWELRRSLITKLLQRNATSIKSLHSLSIKEFRHKEKYHAIPEGEEEEEEEDEDEDDDDDDDDEDSLVTSLSTIISISDLNESESNNTESDGTCNYDVERKEVTTQIEEQRRHRRTKNVFHRMKRRFVGAKSSSVVVVATIA